MKFWPFILIIIIMILSIVAVGETNNQVNYLQVFSNIGTLLAACAAWYTASLNTASLKQQKINIKNNIDPLLVIENDKKYEMEYKQNEGYANFLLNWDSGELDVHHSDSNVFLKMYNIGNGIAKNISVQVKIENLIESINELVNYISDKKNVNIIKDRFGPGSNVLAIVSMKYGLSYVDINDVSIHKKVYLGNVNYNNETLIQIPAIFLVIYNIILSTKLINKILLEKQKIIFPSLLINIECKNIDQELVRFSYKLNLKSFSPGNIDDLKFGLFFETSEI